MLQLHTEHLTAPDAAPQKWLAFTHGIFGSGANWRSIARKVIAAKPQWGAVLIDLRGHGKSPVGDAPYTLAACAADLVATLAASAGAGREVLAISGHSFGGKVVMALAQQPAWRPVQRFILDSSPSARAEAWRDDALVVPQVLRLLETMPTRWASREAFVAQVQAQGIALSVAQWLGLSVNRVEDAYVLQLAVPAMRPLLADYYAQDMWSAAFDVRAPTDFLVATQSNTLTPQDRTQLAQAPAHVHVGYIDAGHWLHVDAPARVVAAIVDGLR